MPNLPALRLTILTISGIFTSHVLNLYFDLRFSVLLYIASMLTIAFLGACVLALISKKKLLLAISFTLYAPVFISVIVCYSFFRMNFIPSNSVLNHVNSWCNVKGSIASKPAIKNKINFRLNVDSIKSHKHKDFVSAEGNVQIYISKNVISLDSLILGRGVHLSTYLNLPPKAQSPSDFDYRDYLKSKGVFATAFVGKEHQIHFYPRNLDTYSFHSMVIYPIIRWLSEAIDKLIPEGDSQALIKGLILGDRSTMSREIIESFRNTGTIHVLSISGLHVGLIALLLNILTVRFQSHRIGKWLSFLTICAFLTTYAMVTGASPPVVRAVIMSIIFLIAPLFGKKSYPMNTLCLALTILLILNPQNLFSVSFYLTTSAVFGLLWIYPKIIDRSPEKLKENYLWKILCVTVAASIATSPFVAYFFKGVPVVGLIANIIVVDLISLCIYLMIPALIFYVIWLPIANIYGAVAYGLASLSINIIMFFNNLPFSRINISITFLYFLLYLSFIIFIFSSKPHKGKPGIVFLIIANITVWHPLILNSTTVPFHQITFRNHRGQTFAIYQNPNDNILINPPSDTSNTYFKKALENKGVLFKPTMISFTNQKDSTYKTHFTNVSLTPRVLRIETKVGSLWAVRSLKVLPKLNFKNGDIVILLLSRFWRKEYLALEKLSREKALSKIVISFTKFLPHKQKMLFYHYKKKHEKIKTIEKDGEIIASFKQGKSLQA